MEQLNCEAWGAFVRQVAEVQQEGWSRERALGWSALGDAQRGAPPDVVRGHEHLIHVVYNIGGHTPAAWAQLITTSCLETGAERGNAERMTRAPRRDWR
jgi:hypothetical protein